MVGNTRRQQNIIVVVGSLNAQHSQSLIYQIEKQNENCWVVVLKLPFPHSIPLRDWGTPLPSPHQCFFEQGITDDLRILIFIPMGSLYLPIHLSIHDIYFFLSIGRLHLYLYLYLYPHLCIQVLNVPLSLCLCLYFYN